VQVVFAGCGDVIPAERGVENARTAPMRFRIYYNDSSASSPLGQTRRRQTLSAA